MENPGLRHRRARHPDACGFWQGRRARHLRLRTWLSAVERRAKEAARCAPVRGPGTVVENLPEAGQVDDERPALRRLGRVGDVRG